MLYTNSVRMDIKTIKNILIIALYMDIYKQN